MYGRSGNGATLLPLAGVNLAKRAIEFLHDLAERQFERRPAPDQHIIMAGVQASANASHRIAQAPSHPVTLDGVTHLPRHRKTYPDLALVCAPARLQHEGSPGRPHCTRGSAKVRPALQPLHDETIVETGDTRRSRTEPLASMRAPRRQNPAAALARHAGAEPVAALTHQFARLVRPFHQAVSAATRPTRRLCRASAQLARLIRDPLCGVNLSAPASARRADGNCTPANSPNSPRASGGCRPHRAARWRPRFPAYADV